MLTSSQASKPHEYKTTTHPPTDRCGATSVAKNQDWNKSLCNFQLFIWYFSWISSKSRPTTCPINWNYKVFITRASTKVAAATSSSPTICSSTTVTGVLADSFSTSAVLGTGVIRLCSFFLCCFNVSRVFTRAPQIWDKETISWLKSNPLKGGDAKMVVG